MLVEMDHTTLNVSNDTKQKFEKAKAAIAEKAEGRMTQDKAISVLAESYLEQDTVEETRAEV